HMLIRIKKNLPSLPYDFHHEDSKTPRPPHCTALTRLSNHARNSLSDDRDIKVDDESQAFARKLEITDHLGSKNRMHFLYRFHIDDHRFFNEQIEPQRFVDHVSVIDNRDRNLPPHSQSSFSQFLHQALLVN